MTFFSRCQENVKVHRAWILIESARFPPFGFDTTEISSNSIENIILEEKHISLDVEKRLGWLVGQVGLELPRRESRSEINLMRERIDKCWYTVDVLCLFPCVDSFCACIVCFKWQMKTKTLITIYDDFAKVCKQIATAYKCLVWLPITFS